MPRSSFALLAFLPLFSACFDPTEVDETETDAETENAPTGTGPTGGDDSPTNPSDPTNPTVDPDSTGDTPTTLDASDTVAMDTGVCDSEGCPCDGPTDCAGALACVDDMCAMTVCGDRMVQGREQCDDGNATDGDGCDMDCTYTEIQIDVSYQNTCALIEGGRVRCWGVNNVGQLGYGNTDNIGDDELPSDAGDVMLPDALVYLASGDEHTCGLLSSGDETICWGAGSGGRLGYANTFNIGDDEFPSALGPIMIGSGVDRVTVGGTHACVITATGTVVCWGLGGGGQLGYGNSLNIGDDETPSAAGNVMIGAAINDVSAGIGHTCAIQSNGAVRCWGGNSQGQLGYGNVATIGDDETPAAAPGAPLNFGETAVQIGAGLSHTCALFESGAVRCWGRNFEGETGTGDAVQIGDDEPATMGMPADLGGPATEIAVGDNHTCALLEDGSFRCWGSNGAGELGLGMPGNVGDDEVPSSVDPVMLDGEVIDFDAGGAHTCVVLDDYRVRCWGNNGGGQLGYGNTDNVGDDELPTDVEPVSVL